MSRLEGHVGVIITRLQALKDAILADDRDQIEWHYDRVLRATTKLDRLLKEDKPDGSN